MGKRCCHSPVEGAGLLEKERSISLVPLVGIPVSDYQCLTQKVVLEGWAGGGERINDCTQLCCYSRVFILGSSCNALGMGLKLIMYLPKAMEQAVH